MFGYIYITTNLINGKKYIGQHRSKVFDFINYKGSGKILKRAFKKYGKSNFKCELLESINNIPTICDTAKELNESEIYYIKYYNCILSDEYYNMAEGGQGKSYSALSPEEQQARNKKISESRKGQKLSEERKRKLSEFAKTRTGEKNSNWGNHKLRDRYASGDYVSPCKGVPHTEEYKQALSKRMKELGVHSGKTNPSYGKHWYTNGIEEILCYEQECPDGWHRGRL